MKQYLEFPTLIKFDIDIKISDPHIPQPESVVKELVQKETDWLIWV